MVKLLKMPSYSLKKYKILIKKLIIGCTSLMRYLVDSSSRDISEIDYFDIKLFVLLLHLNIILQESQKV